MEEGNVEAKIKKNRVRCCLLIIDLSWSLTVHRGLGGRALLSRRMKVGRDGTRGKKPKAKKKVW